MNLPSLYLKQLPYISNVFNKVRIFYKMMWENSKKVGPKMDSEIIPPWVKENIRRSEKI